MLVVLFSNNSKSSCKWDLNPDTFLLIQLDLSFRFGGGDLISIPERIRQPGEHRNILLLFPEKFFSKMGSNIFSFPTMQKTGSVLSGDAAI